MKALLPLAFVALLSASAAALSGIWQTPTGYLPARASTEALHVTTQVMEVSK